MPVLVVLAVLTVLGALRLAQINEDANTAQQLERDLLSLDPPVRWGLWGWRVHQKGLLKWQSVDVNCQQTRHSRRHFL